MNISTIAPLPRIPLAQAGPLPIQVRPLDRYASNWDADHAQIDQLRAMARGQAAAPAAGADQLLALLRNPATSPQERAQATLRMGTLARGSQGEEFDRLRAALRQELVRYPQGGGEGYGKLRPNPAAQAMEQIADRLQPEDIRALVGEGESEDRFGMDNARTVAKAMKYQKSPLLRADVLDRVEFLARANHNFTDENGKTRQPAAYLLGEMADYGVEGSVNECGRDGVEANAKLKASKNRHDQRRWSAYLEPAPPGPGDYARDLVREEMNVNPRLQELLRLAALRQELHTHPDSPLAGAVDSAKLDQKIVNLSKDPSVTASYERMEERKKALAKPLAQYMRKPEYLEAVKVDSEGQSWAKNPHLEAHLQELYALDPALAQSVSRELLGSEFKGQAGSLPGAGKFEFAGQGAEGPSGFQIARYSGSAIWNMANGFEMGLMGKVLAPVGAAFSGVGAVEDAQAGDVGGAVGKGLSAAGGVTTVFCVPLGLAITGLGMLVDGAFGTSPAERLAQELGVGK